MTATVLELTILLLTVITVILAVCKWQIVRDRSLILSVIRNALSAGTSRWIGILAGVVYLAVFMILGGQGGRIHVLFGRVIWNTTPTEVLTGILLAALVMLSMALFVYGLGMMGAKQSGRKGGIGFAGSMLAVIAAFCP